MTFGVICCFMDSLSTIGLQAKKIFKKYIFKHKGYLLWPSMIFKETQGGPKKSLWCDLEEQCLRNSKIFYDGVFLSIFSHLLKKLELSKLCRKKLLGSKNPENGFFQKQSAYQKRDIFFCSFLFLYKSWMAYCKSIYSFILVGFFYSCLIPLIPFRQIIKRTAYTKIKITVTLFLLILKTFAKNELSVYIERKRI